MKKCNIKINIKINCDLKPYKRRRAPKFHRNMCKGRSRSQPLQEELMKHTV